MKVVEYRGAFQKDPTPPSYKVELVYKRVPDPEKEVDPENENW